MSPSDKDGRSKPSGRVRHESGGRAVWEWAVESGKHAIDSTSALLKKLDLSGLRLVDDRKKGTGETTQEETLRLQDADPHSPALGGDREVDPLSGKRGFNPYDSRVAPQRKPGKPRPPAKPRITQPVRPAKPPGLFARLFGRKK